MRAVSSVRVCCMSLGGEQQCELPSHAREVQLQTRHERGGMLHGDDGTTHRGGDLKDTQSNNTRAPTHKPHGSSEQRVRVARRGGGCMEKKEKEKACGGLSKSISLSSMGFLSNSNWSYLCRHQSGAGEDGEQREVGSKAVCRRARMQGALTIMSLTIPEAMNPCVSTNRSSSA